MDSIVITAICVGKADGMPKKDRVPSVAVTASGLAGDRHQGELWTVRSGKDKGGTVFNERQWSAVSDEEIALLTERLGIEIPVGALGENFRFAGAGRLTQLPCGTMLKVSSGVVLGVAGENKPCQKMASYLANFTKADSVRREFIRAAEGIRGVVGWVEAPGVVTEGDTAVLEWPEVEAVRVP